MMQLLAVEASAKAVSAAWYQGETCVASYFVDTKQTHSQTLMPMVESVLAVSGKQLREVDFFAVGVGPGSFTGIRIAVSCVKGLAFPRQTPCIPVSTLDAIAWGSTAYEGHVVCGVMDARCNQVYHANFLIKEGKPQRLCDDQAVAMEELPGLCKAYDQPILLAGDGAIICKNTLPDWQVHVQRPCLQTADGVAQAALAKLAANQPVLQPEALMPVYLRMPQAERERRKREQEAAKS